MRHQRNPGKAVLSIHAVGRYIITMDRTHRHCPVNLVSPHIIASLIPHTNSTAFNLPGHELGSTPKPYLQPHLSSVFRLRNSASYSALPFSWPQRAPPPLPVRPPVHRETLHLWKPSRNPATFRLVPELAQNCAPAAEQLFTALQPASKLIGQADTGLSASPSTPWSTASLRTACHRTEVGPAMQDPQMPIHREPISVHSTTSTWILIMSIISAPVARRGSSAS